MSKNVKIVRLKYTSEEIICDFHETSTHITLKEPYLVFTQPQPNGEFAFGIVPWCMLGKDKEFKILKSDALCVFDTHGSFEKTYLEKTTGIILSGAK